MFAIFVKQEALPSDCDSSNEVAPKSADLNMKSLEEDNFTDEKQPDSTGVLLHQDSYIKMSNGSRVHLQLVASSLSVTLVGRLTNHIRRKLSSSGLQALAGTTDLLDGSEADNSELAVLFCNQDEWIVCLLDASLQKLDAFHHQLCDHIRQQIPGFVAAAAASSESEDSPTAAAAAASAAFASWEDATVAALQRTVKLLRNVLPPLITLAFAGCDFSVDCPDAERRREVLRFIGQCRLLETAAAAASPEQAGGQSQDRPESQDQAPALFPRSAVVRISGRSVALDFGLYTDFAKTWSAALLDSVDDENPVRLQQRILDLKVRASRDVNATKRLLVEAVGDYYALYRLIQCLRQTGNAAVLLHSLCDLGRPEEREAIDCVRAYLTAASSPLLLGGAAPPAAAAV